MTISSRTPEGQPNHCPVCGADVCIDPSPLFGDATCPNCGTLLWFLNLAPHALADRARDSNLNRDTTPQSHVFQRSRARSIRERVIAIVAEQLGVDPAKITDNMSIVNDLGVDSLDAVELLMELGEDFDVQDPPLT